MLHRYEYKDIIWIDLVSPDLNEVQQVSQEFGIDPDVAHELLSPTLRAHTEKYLNHLYLVLHFPSLESSTDTTSHEQEIDFVIGKNFIVTTRYADSETFAEFHKIFEVNAPLEDDLLHNNPYDIFLLLSRNLYKAVEKEIHVVSEKLEYIEKEIFRGYEKEMVVALSHAGRDILNLKQVLDPHQEILHSLVVLTEDFAGHEYMLRARAIENMYYRSRKYMTRIWQTLNELRETNNSLLTAKQNEVMLKLTIMAFVTFPLMLTTSAFGMNATYIPIVGSRFDFWIITGLMAIGTFFMFLFFRYKRWL